MNASHLICSTTEGVQIDTNAERCIYIYLISGKVSARRSFQSHHFCAARAPCFSENIFSESRKFVRRGEFHLARYLVPAAVVVYCTVVDARRICRISVVLWGWLLVRNTHLRNRCSCAHCDARRLGYVSGMPSKPYYPNNPTVRV